MELHSITFPGLPDPYKVAPASHLDDKNNPHGVTPAQIGAAPAGYGLGGSCVDVDSWDNAIESGWYRSSGNAHINGRTYGYVTKHADNWVIQEAFQIDDVGNVTQKATRAKIAGVWQSWEWVNPPMVLGTEYRTTERWNGKAVYTKLIDFGTMPSNEEKIVPHGIANLEYPLSISVVVKSSGWSFTLPSDYKNEERVSFSYSGIIIKTTVDRSEYTAYATLKYTKSV